MKTNTVEIKMSTVEGQGVFAARDIKKDEVVIVWHPKSLSQDELTSVSKKERNYIMITDEGRFQLMQIPERYVNHSCNPNTVPIDGKDVAARDIAKGEEITTDYGNTNFEFECKCGSVNCRGRIGELNV